MRNNHGIGALQLLCMAAESSVRNVLERASLTTGAFNLHAGVEFVY